MHPVKNNINFIRKTDRHRGLPYVAKKSTIYTFFFALIKKLTFNRSCEVFKFGCYRFMKFITSPYWEDEQAYENADGKTHPDC